MRHVNAITDIADTVIKRLGAVTELSDADRQLLQKYAVRSQRRVAVRRELVTEGEPITRPVMVLKGWGARVRVLSDGRRQIIAFILPGDLLGVGRRQGAPASSTALALTEMVVGDAPADEELAHPSSLSDAYAAITAMEEFYLQSHITRLGRMSAYERCADFLLELGERLALSGFTGSNSFDMPLTQECLADALGLTSVHINRMMQALRRDGVITAAGGRVTLHDRGALTQLVDHRPAPALRRRAA